MVFSIFSDMGRHSETDATGTTFFRPDRAVSQSIITTTYEAFILD